METFAARAKAIMKKYDRFKDDPISKATMDIELKRLAKEQEEYKAANGIGQPEGGETQEFAYGGGMYNPRSSLSYGQEAQTASDYFNNGMGENLYHQNTINSRTSQFDNVPTWNGAPQGNPPYPNFKKQVTPEFGGFEQFTDPIEGEGTVLRAPTPPPRNVGHRGLNKNTPAGQSSTGGAGSMMQNKSNEMLGNAVKASAAENAAENKKMSGVGWAGMAGYAGSAYQLFDTLLNKPEKVDYGRIDAETINSEPQKRDARRTINTSANNQLNASRETSQTAGQRMARMGAIENNRRNTLANTLHTIQNQVDNTNAQIRNDNNAQNKRIDIMEINANDQNRAARQQVIAQNLNAIGSGVGQQRQEQGQSDVINRLNERYINAINNGTLTDYKILKNGLIVPLGDGK